MDQAWRATPDTFGRRLSSGTQSAPKHIRLIGWLLYLCATGYLRRLTVALPPGFAKSTSVSRWFPAWDLEMRPHHRIMLNSYEATLAEEHGKEVRAMLRDNFEVLTVRLNEESQAANRWQTTKLGGMWTSGAQGSITGRRAHIYIVDDPFKGYEDSHSPTVREKVFKNWQAVGRTRLFPGGSMLAVQTRWHPEDLIGHLEEIPGFVHLTLPALAEQDESIKTILGPEFVAKCARDGIYLPKWSRKSGESLWPWLVEPCAAVPDGVPWFTETELAEARIEVGELVFSSLYQQHPSMVEGNLFKRSNWEIVDAAPGNLDLIRRWDKAATKNAGDWTAGVLMGMAADGEVYVLDVRRTQEGPAGVQRFITQTAREDYETYGHRLHIILEQEGGSAGVEVTDSWTKTHLAGYNATFKTSTGDKVVRAFPLRAAQEAHHIHLVRAVNDQGLLFTPKWHGKFIEEAAAFPTSGAHDDMIDAASHAYNELTANLRLRLKASIGRAHRTLNPTRPTSANGTYRHPKHYMHLHTR